MILFGIVCLPLMVAGLACGGNTPTNGPTGPNALADQYFSVKIDGQDAVLADDINLQNGLPCHTYLWLNKSGDTVSAGAYTWEDGVLTLADLHGRGVFSGTAEPGSLTIPMGGHVYEFVRTLL